MVNGASGGFERAVGRRDQTRCQLICLFRKQQRFKFSTNLTNCLAFRNTDLNFYTE